MRAILLASFVVVFGLVSPVHASTLTEAEVAYNLRDFSEVGLKSAQTAASIYGELAQSADNQESKNNFLIGQSMSYYFVGTAVSKKDDKIKYHLKGYEAADMVVKSYGISDVEKVSDEKLDELAELPEQKLNQLGEALYYRGINLGQWGNANGVLDSLSRWPELRDNMFLLVNLGLEGIHEFGAYRVLGRGYFKIPGILGGSMKKATKYLTDAVKGSVAEGQFFSTNGTNNIYYAELLKETGETKTAIAYLAKFISADVNQLHPDLVPENKNAQKEAQELIKSWK